MRLTLLFVLTATAAACSAPQQELVFLTRAGCVQTDEMRQHLNAAIVKAGWSGDYQVIDIGSLPNDDARHGYPTPTLLFHGRDVYGMPVPEPPFPEPT